MQEKKKVTQRRNEMVALKRATSYIIMSSCDQGKKHKVKNVKRQKLLILERNTPLLF